MAEELDAVSADEEAGPHDVKKNMKVAMVNKMMRFIEPNYTLHVHKLRGQDAIFNLVHYMFERVLYAMDMIESPHVGNSNYLLST